MMNDACLPIGRNDERCLFCANQQLAKPATTPHKKILSIRTTERIFFYIFLDATNAFITTAFYAEFHL